MERAKAIATLFAALLTMTVAGCAATPARESTGQYIDDATITTKVKAAILDEPSLKVNEISVDTDRGVVRLSGYVHSSDNIQTAAELAARIDGVTSVKNDLQSR